MLETKFVVVTMCPKEFFKFFTGYTFFFYYETAIYEFKRLVIYY